MWCDAILCLSHFCCCWKEKKKKKKTVRQHKSRKKTIRFISVDRRHTLLTSCKFSSFVRNSMLIKCQAVALLYNFFYTFCTDVNDVWSASNAFSKIKLSHFIFTFSPFVGSMHLYGIWIQCFFFLPLALTQFQIFL